MKRLTLVTLAVCTLTACSNSGPSSPGAVVGFGGGATAGDATSARPSDAPSIPRNFVAHLSGDNEIPPRDTLAQGQVVFQLNAEGTELTYRLISSNIENVVAAHIHLGPPQCNCPVVQFLFGNVPAGGGAQNGVLATGTIDGSSLTGPLSGMTLSALIAQMEQGNTYVNVHTNDGVAPTNTGAGDFPGGEIRGQVRSIGQ